MKLIISLSTYFISLIFVGFSGLFAVAGNGLYAWPQYASTLMQQFALPQRAPFAGLIVMFVIAVPTIVATWHWRRLKLGQHSSPGSMAGRASVVGLGLYAVLVVAVPAMAQAAPPFSVMEGVNLKFSVMLLGAWSALAIILAMPAGAAVNRLLGSKPYASSTATMPQTAKTSEPGKPGLGGMTLNERLVHVGMADLWDEAVRRRDRTAMIVVLERVEVTNPDVIVDQVLANPHTYGF